MNLYFHFRRKARDKTIQRFQENPIEVKAQEKILLVLILIVTFPTSQCDKGTSWRQYFSKIFYVTEHPEIQILVMKHEKLTLKR